MENDLLHIEARLPIKAINGGLFISRGIGKHPERIIDTYELIYVRSGNLGISEEDTNYEVYEGQSLILYPGHKHGGIQPYSSDLSFYWIHFRLNQETMAAGNQNISLPKYTQLPNPDQLIGLLRLFLDHQEHGEDHSISLDLLLLTILSEVSNSRILSTHNNPYDLLASRAETFIHTHFHEPLKTSLIAANLQCNPDYLGRIYNRARGKTLTDAIHNIRVKHAIPLLLDGHLNINEIAKKCGFEDSAYFCRIFKRSKGVSPSTYRRTYSLLHVNTQ
jgi:AraC-like DNA-binding protein